MQIEDLSSRFNLQGEQENLQFFVDTRVESKIWTETLICFFLWEDAESTATGFHNSIGTESEVELESEPESEPEPEPETGNLTPEEAFLSRRLSVFRQPQSVASFSVAVSGVQTSGKQDDFKET